MSEGHKSFLPAAGHDWALPLYDPLVKLLGGDRTRRTLVEQASLTAGQDVLEIGCGTGSVSLEVKRRHPNVEVVGLDPDPKALARARRKADRAGVAIRFDQGYSDALPYPEACFDRVLSSFMFHHLPGAAKVETLREVRRVLKPGGALYLLDFAGHGSGHGLLARFLGAHRHLKDNDEGNILGLLSEAGLTEARKLSQDAILFGHARVDTYRASAPGSASV